MLDHVPVALLVAVQQGLSVAPVEAGEAGEAGQTCGEAGQHPGSGEERIVERHQVRHRVTHGEPRASALNVVSRGLPGVEAGYQVGGEDRGLPGILIVRHQRGSVELQHGVLGRGAGEGEDSLGWPARSGGLHQYNDD